MSAVYLKKLPTASRRLHSNRMVKRSLATGLFVIGFLAILSAVIPIISFQLKYSGKFGQIINPLSAKFYNQSDNVLGDLTPDYTQLSSWFVTGGTMPDNISTDNKPTIYRLSIPSAKIDDAIVALGSMDLKNSLIQYPQTALPGQLGNTVIFGHSVLPQFFNPKSYLTIFSTLYKRKVGDEIYIKFDNITYKYIISDMFEVQPTDLSVLEQRFDNRYLTLITCSPPGTYLRRLIIRAQIADY